MITNTEMEQHTKYGWFCLIFLFGWLVACTEDASRPFMNDEEAGHVIICYTVSGNSVDTRAQTVTSEPGIGSRNENWVNELDLFIFRSDGTFYKHVPLPDLLYDDQQNNNYHEWATGLSAEEIHNGDRIYLIANASTTVSAIQTLDGLKAATLTGLECQEKQDYFVMDGNATVAAAMWSDNNLVVPIDLARAAAKVRLSFAGSVDWSQVSYRFCHYASTSSLIDLGDDEDDYLVTLSLENYPAGSAEYPSSYDGLEPASPITEQDKECLVLYSYANSWYAGDGEDDHLNTGAPIDEKRETFILLKAPYDNVLYYYEVPVNYRLPEDNDSIVPDESYKELYRLRRNYIYDITVRIDRPGGTETEPVKLPTLYYSVVKWNEKEIVVPPFM